MKKRLFLTVGLYLAVLLFPPSLLAADKIVLTAACWLAPTHVIAVSGQKFFNLVEEYTDGKVKIKFHTGGSLMSGRDQLQAIRNSTIDFANIAPQYHPGELPLGSYLAMLPLTYTYDTYLDCQRDLFPLQSAEYKKSNAKLLFNAPQSLEWYLKKEIDPNKPDFSGRKLRSLGPISANYIQAFGGVPVSMPSGEIAVALATGAIDGCMTSLNSGKAWELYKDAPYVYITAGNITYNSWIMNIDTWNKLPKDVQSAIERAAEEMVQWSWFNAKEKDSATIADWEKNPKIYLTKLTPAHRKIWLEKISFLYDEFETKLGDRATSTMKVLDKYR